MASLVPWKAAVVAAQLSLVATSALAQTDSSRRADSLLLRVQQLVQVGDTTSLRVALSVVDSFPSTHRFTAHTLRTMVAFRYADLLLGAAQQSNSCLLAKEAERFLIVAQQHIPATKVDIPQLRAHLVALPERSDSVRAVFRRACGA